MNTLADLLTQEVADYELTKGVILTDERRNNLVKGLEFYIKDYLSEQIPEQVDLLTK